MCKKPMTFDDCVKAAGKYLFYGRSVWTMKDMAEVTDYIRRLFRPLFDEQQATIAERDKEIGELKELIKFANQELPALETVIIGDRQGWGCRLCDAASLSLPVVHNEKCPKNILKVALSEQPGGTEEE